MFIKVACSARTSSCYSFVLCFLFQFRIGGSNKHVWKHALDKHEAKCVEIGAAPKRNQPEMRTLDDGTEVTVMAFEDSKRFAANVRLVKMMQRFGDPLSRCESKEVHDLFAELDPTSKPYVYETLLDVQAAQRNVQKASAFEEFKARRDAGLLMGGQIDLWFKFGVKFASFNYTYLELGMMNTTNGPVPRWYVKSAISTPPCSAR